MSLDRAAFWVEKSHDGDDRWLVSVRHGERSDVVYGSHREADVDDVIEAIEHAWVFVVREVTEAAEARGAERERARVLRVLDEVGVAIAEVEAQRFVTPAVAETARLSLRAVARGREEILRGEPAKETT